mmetsp:Transcript_34145/g.38846  ORF Transcript_34145/g.38846 Transcript_34145/m.38846 type:complete len:224 (+) Transcript_34145:144-815(+)
MVLLENLIENISDACCSDGAKQSVGKLYGTVSASKEDEVAAITEKKEETANKEVAKNTEKKVKSAENTAEAEESLKTKNDGGKKEDSLEFTENHMKYELSKWQELPEKIKKSAVALGYKEETWNSGEWSDSDYKWWDNMTKSEQTAAEIIGWDKTAWDTKYEDVNFSHLPQHVKTAAASVGFDEQAWNENSWPEGTKHKWWTELTNEEKGAYAILGYSQWTWE